MQFRQFMKNIANGLVYPFGARFVGAHWGPRGFRATLLRLKAAGFRPATIIDIGASDGKWSRECFEVFPSANYALFDALQENQPALEQISAAHQNVAFWIGALGSDFGKSTLQVHGDQSSLFASDSFPGQPRLVETRPLDSFIETMKFKPPLLIKADVQGYELEVSRGAKDCLTMAEVVLLEVSFLRVYKGSPLAHDVVSHLEVLGFRLYDICTYVQRPFDGVLAHSDLLFIKKQSSLVGSENWR